MVRAVRDSASLCCWNAGDASIAIPPAAVDGFRRCATRIAVRVRPLIARPTMAFSKRLTGHKWPQSGSGARVRQWRPASGCSRTYARRDPAPPDKLAHEADACCRAGQRPDAEHPPECPHVGQTRGRARETLDHSRRDRFDVERRRKVCRSLLDHLRAEALFVAQHASGGLFRSHTTPPRERLQD